MNLRLSRAFLASIFLFVGFASVAEAARAPRMSRVPWAKVERQLRADGLSRKFVQSLRKNYRLDHRERTLTLNILSFLGAPNHATLVTDEAVERTRAFVQAQRGDLEAAERKYGVPADVIGALLWIETRHGTLTGSFHVPSVYLTLYMAKDAAAQAYLKKVALVHPNRSLASNELTEKIRTRCERKSEWALAQLKFLERLQQKEGDRVKRLKGSFAGAFGIPQFIPESFAKWAVASDRKRVPDLYRMDDAVLSVGNYLKLNGWGADREAKMRALMHYNNSVDYAEAILELAEKASHGPEVVAN